MKTTSKIAVAGILLFASTMPSFAAGIGTQVNSVLENARAQGPRDPYTDGQSVTQRDVYTGGANVAQRDVYTNGL